MPNQMVGSPKSKSRQYVEKSVLFTQTVPKTLPLDCLVPFTSHPFKLYEGERLDDMVRSLKELGVLLPIIVRPKNRVYEILSGHNRVNAARIAGLTDLPVIIKTGLSDDEAKLIVTESNLVQRPLADLSYIECAIALKTHMEAISKQGKRNDLIDEINMLSNPHKINKNESSHQFDTKMRSNEKAGSLYGLSKGSVARYIRLTHLIDLLQNRVDNNEIEFAPAVMISYLTHEDQDSINQVLSKTTYKIDIEKAFFLQLHSGKKLTEGKILQILSGEFDTKPKLNDAPPLKIKAKIYQKHFNESYTQSEMESIIDKALTDYFANNIHIVKSDYA